MIKEEAEEDGGSITSPQGVAPQIEVDSLSDDSGSGSIVEGAKGKFNFVPKKAEDGDKKIEMGKPPTAKVVKS